MGERAERNKFAGLGRNVDEIERSGILLEFGSDFEDDVILVQSFVDVGRKRHRECCRHPA